MQALGATATEYPPRLLELQRYVLGETELVAAVMSTMVKPIGSSPLPAPTPATRWWFVARDGLASRGVAVPRLRHDTTHVAPDRPGRRHRRRHGPGRADRHP